MTQVEELLQGYAVDLNDAEPGHEFTVWSREQLLRYHNEGLCLVASLRPDMFTKTKVVKVTPCQEEQDMCDCTVVHKVLGQTDANGNVLHRLRVKDVKSAMVWVGVVCHNKGRNTTLREYSIETGTNKVSVYPAITSGVDAWIKVECATSPDMVTLDSMGDDILRCAFSVAVSQWVMYRAKEIDELSPTLRAASVAHFTTFGTILGLVRASDDVYRSILKAAKA